MAFDKRKYSKKLTYEGSGSFAEIEDDLAHVRGLDEKSQNVRWMRWLVPLPLPVMVGIAFAANSNDASPILAASGLVLLIVAWIIYARLRRFDVENRRYEFANGLIRLLDLDPSVPLRVGLVLSDMERGEKVIGRQNNWTYYRDPWFYVEGQLADGLRFHYGRTGYFDSYYHSTTTTSGNRRITRTRTQKVGHFDDALTFQFDPARFPTLASLGDGARNQLQLPEGIEVKHFENAPGKLQLIVHCNFKWDATPGGQTKGVDAVAFGGLLFLSLYQLLGSAEPKIDLARARALPPPKAIAPKAPLTRKEMVLVGAAALVGAGALSLFVTSYFYFGDASRSADSAQELKDKVKRSRQCRRSGGHSIDSGCYGEATERGWQQLVDERLERANEDATLAIVWLVAGLVLAGASGAGLLVWRKKRPLWIAQAEAAGADMAPTTPAGSAMAPNFAAGNPGSPEQQGNAGYPQGAPQPGGYPQGAPPPGGYPQGAPPPGGYPQGGSPQGGYPPGSPAAGSPGPGSGWQGGGGPHGSA